MAYRHPIDTLDVDDVLTVGEATISRRAGNYSTAALNASGRLRLAYFTARKSETITQVRTDTTVGALQSTATLCRIGIWTVDAAGALLSLVASTTNDTALWSAQAVYTKSLAASFAKVRGQRYAVGVLCVGATTVTMLGAAIGSANENAASPRISGFLDGQTDLPATASAGSISNSAVTPYVVLLP